MSLTPINPVGVLPDKYSTHNIVTRSLRPNTPNRKSAFSARAVSRKLPEKNCDLNPLTPRLTPVGGEDKCEGRGYQNFEASFRDTTLAQVTTSGLRSAFDEDP
jgi:hypothetical protein